MSTTRTKSKARRGGANVGLVVSLSIFAIAVLAVAFGMGGGAEEPATLSTGSAEQAAGTIAGLKATGEISGMGVPVVEVPGAATGTASAAGVTVDGANWAMGQVPLDIAVRPYWTLTNTGSDPITLGEPQAEVREGCCPGPFAMERTRLAPGESTTLTFELGMSEGMDGWHDMGVYVPVEGGGGAEVLELSVTGDFRN
jgi:hypothetical protein